MPWGLARFQHSGRSHFVTFGCYHRPIRLLRGAQSLRAGSGCLPRTQAGESSSPGGTSHPKIAKSAILGWGTRRCRAFLAKELLRFQHSELPAVCGEAALYSSQSGEGWVVAGGRLLHQSRNSQDENYFQSWDAPSFAMFGRSCWRCCCGLENSRSS